jgi:hypothetical protein
LSAVTDEPMTTRETSFREVGLWTGSHGITAGRR